MSRVNVKVIPRAKQSTVTHRDGMVVVRTTAPAIDGAANEAVIRLLADYYHVSRSNIRILHGHTARRKVVEVLDGTNREE